MKTTIRFVAVALAYLCVTASASGQNAGTVTNHAFALGKGAGTMGYTSLLCASAQLAVGQSAADPICVPMTGDVTMNPSGVTVLGNIPNATPMAGSLLATNITAPATPPSGKVYLYSDSTAKNVQMKNDVGTVTTMVLPSTAVANNFLTGLDAFGQLTRAQPAFSNLSGSWVCSQAAAFTGDVTTSAGFCATTIAANAVTFAKFQQIAALSMFGNCTNALANGAAVTGTANQVLRVNGAGTSCGFGAIDLSQAAAVGGTLQAASEPAHTGDVTNSAGSLTLAIAANAVTNAKMATMAAGTIKANATGGAAVPTDVGSATARSSSLLNVDSFTGHGDSIYTILATDRTVGTNAAFTASRTWTMPAANAVNPGQEIIVADFQGTVTGVNTLVISRSGSDTVNGGTTVTISAANGAYLFKSDGTSKWTAQALGAAAAGGVSSVAQTVSPSNSLSVTGSPITTSGTLALTLNSGNNLGAPYFRAYLSANQSVTSGTTTKVNFDTVDFDIGTLYNTTTHVYQPNVAGTYQVCTAVLPNGTFTLAADNFQVILSKNGTLGSGGISQNLFVVAVPSVTGDGTTAAVCAPVQMNGSTDTVEVDVIITGTSPVVKGTSNRPTQITATRIGPQ